MARTIMCALPLPSVVETMRPLPARPLGRMPHFVRGVSIIRGAAVLVVDGGALLGLAAGQQTTRFVTVRSGERTVALAFEAVVGVRSLQSVSLETLPPLLQRVRPRVVSLIGGLDAALLAVLNDVRVVPEWVWRALGADGDTACPPA